VSAQESHINNVHFMVAFLTFQQELTVAFLGPRASHYEFLDPWATATQRGCQ